MGVFKRGKMYWYEFVFDGQRIRKSTRQGNQNVARHMEAAHRAALVKGELGIRDKTRIPSFREFSERFLSSIEIDAARKPRTLKAYQTAIRGLLDFPGLAQARLDRVDEALIDAFKQHRRARVSRRGRPYSVSTLNQEIGALRRVLGLAHEWRVIDRIPKVRKMRAPAGEDFVLSSQQEELYLGSAEPDYRDFAVLLLDTGLRVNEGLSLEWSEVHLKPPAGSELGYLTVLAAKAKNSKARNVPLTPRLAETLTGRKGRSGYVFSAQGEALKPRWVQRHHDHLRTLLELPCAFVPHSFRHSFGTRLGEARTDAFTIMRLMGHSTIAMSAKYVHPTPDAVERAISNMVKMQDQKKMSPPKSPQ